MSRRPASSSRFVRSKHIRQQGGYLLVDLALYLVISTALLASQFSQLVAAMDENDAKSTGKYLVKLQDGVNQYVNANSVALKSGNTVTGFANPLQPQISELIAASYLEAGFSDASPLGLRFKNVLGLSGTCPSGPDCKISGWAYSTSAYTDAGGNQKTGVLAVAMTSIGPDASISYPETPAFLTTVGGGTVANPAGSIAGILGIRIGAGSGLLPLLSQYYKRDGTDALTGPMNAGGYDINSVGNLQVTNTTTTNDINVSGSITLSGSGATPGASCGSNPIVQKSSTGNAMVICSGGVWQLVGNVVSGASDGAPCSSAGQLGTNETGVSFVCNGSYWTSLNVTANAGDSCAPAGRMAAAVNNREQLVCKNGAYVRLVNLIAKSVEVSRLLVTDGGLVPKPTCDVGGAPAYSFQLTQTVVDVSVTPPKQAMYIAAVDNGSSWSIRIRLKDNGGTEYSANAYSISAVMKLECSY